MSPHRGFFVFYEDPSWRIIEIEQGHFTPLILSTSGGMGPECAIFVKLLAKKITQKKNQDQADVI